MGVPDREGLPPGEGDRIVITSLIRFKVFPEKEQILPMVWGAQKGMLNDVAGFVHAQLLKDLSAEHSYIIQTTWETEAALLAWKTEARERSGEHMARMLKGESVMVDPPYDVVHYEVLHRSDDPAD